MPQCAEGGGESLEGHWRDLEGDLIGKKGDNYVLPLLLHVPLEGIAFRSYLGTVRGQCPWSCCGRGRKGGGQQGSPV